MNFALLHIAQPVDTIPTLLTKKIISFNVIATRGVVLPPANVKENEIRFIELYAKVIVAYLGEKLPKTKYLNYF
jgi:hypothetical protein